MLTVLKKELKMYFSSMFAYVFYGLYYFVTGILFVVNCMQTYTTQFGYYVLSSSFGVILVFLPLFTMRMFAGEKKEKTDRLLFTLPVSIISILLGKFLAVCIFVFLPVLASVIYPICIAANGVMSVKFLISAYIAVILVTLSCLSIGTFLSAAAPNPLMAAVLSYAVYIIALLVRLMEVAFSGQGIAAFLHDCSIYNKYNHMTSGIVRSGDVIYLLLLCVGFFLATWFVLDAKRKSRKYTVIGIGITALLVILCSVFSLKYTKVYDFTPERLLTLSEETKEEVSAVEKPVMIYYMGDESNANATYQELLNCYADLNDLIEIAYVNTEYDREFKENYLSGVDEIHEASLLVVSKERNVYLDQENYVTATQTSKYSYQYILNLENQLTSAISYVCSNDSFFVYEITGHGEKALNSNFRNSLMMNRYEFKEITLQEEVTTLEQTFSDDCRAVFINAPQTDYSSEEIELLRQYVEKSGRLLVVLDPLNEELTRLYAFLREYGLDIQSGVIIEQDEQRYVEDTPYYIAPEMEDTEFTSDMIADHMQVFSMTSKGILKAGNSKGYHFTKVLTTSPKSYSKVGDYDDLSIKGENDIAGPFSVAAFADHQEEGSIFLLASDVFFLDEVDTNSGGANRRFILNVLDTLTGNSRSVFVEGKDIGNQTALYHTETRTFIKILTIGMIPCIILLIGIFVVLLRTGKIKWKRKNMVEKNEDDINEAS